MSFEIMTTFPVPSVTIKIHYIDWLNVYTMMPLIVVGAISISFSSQLLILHFLRYCFDIYAQHFYKTVHQCSINAVNKK